MGSNRENRNIAIDYQLFRTLVAQIIFPPPVEHEMQLLLLIVEFYYDLICN